MSNLTGIEQRLKRIRLIVCDFDGVLSDGKIFFDGDGKPFRAVHARDMAAFTLWRVTGGRLALVSGLGSAALETIAAQWHCDACVMWIKDKARVCRELVQEMALELDEFCFLGDDLIDRNAMRTAGLAVAVSDAAAEAKAEAHWVTEAPGGRGAFRELVYRILSAQGRLDEAIETYCGREDETESSVREYLRGESAEPRQTGRRCG